MQPKKNPWYASLKKVLFKSKGQLLSNMLTVGIVTLSVKGIAFFKEMTVAKIYGVSILLDTYLIAVLVPTFIHNVFLNSYASVFIPNYVQEQKENKNTNAFIGTSFLVTIAMSLFMIMLTYLCLDYYLEVLFPGHDLQYYELIKTQLWILLPSILFWGISSLITGLLMVADDFLYSSLNAFFVPLVTIIMLLGFQEHFQEKTLALGMLIGSICSCLYLIIISLNKKVLQIEKPDFKNRNIHILLKQVPAKMSSSLMAGANTMVDQYFSAQLALGAIASLSYGYKIPLVFIGLIGSTIGNTLLPYFSKKALEGSKKLYKEFRRIMGISIISMGTITLLLIILSKLIIRLVFERGEFTEKDTDIVYVIQQMYLLQLPFYVIGVVMNKYLTAINKNNFLVFSAFLCLILNIILNFILIHILGIKGVALATALVSLCNSLFIYLYIRKLQKKSIDIAE
jgi:putative peptidoglycan lipid II flippase